MTDFEFIENIFTQYNIPKNYYSLGEILDDAYCIISFGNNKYKLFYYEKGEMYNIKYFDDILNCGGALLTLLRKKK